MTRLLRRRYATFAQLAATCLCLACTPTQLPINQTVTVEACCEGRGLCLPELFVEERAQSVLGREHCAERSLCVPDELRNGDPPATCQIAATAAEGRCLPDCLPGVQARAEQLARDGCGESQRCVPCYDPISGDNTRACDFGAGATELPTVFRPCCGELGRCVPAELLGESERSQLGHDSCAGAALCVPEAALLAGDDYVPLSCTTEGFGTEGRCLPACLPKLAAQIERLKRSSCPDQHVCAPCFDPLTGEPSGACSLAGDPGPRGPATALESCCGDRAVCVPRSVVPASQQKYLGRDTCSTRDTLCVPRELAEATSFVPERCVVSALNAEGRCMSRCLPSIAERGATLARDGCAETEACAPCADPLSGEDTGVCRLGDDPGPAEPPTLLPTCCLGLGRCTPRAWLPVEQRANFAADSCDADRDFVCVAPAAALSDASFVPSACLDSATGAEGRCLPQCLPALASSASVLSRGECSAGQLCAPCFDPRDGSDTGACRLGNDPGPSKAPNPLQTCCSGAGRCVPRVWIPADQRPRFGVDSCDRGEQYACVAPAAALDDPDFVPTSCIDMATGAEGRCLPSCLPEVHQNARALSRSGCSEAQLCVPCFNPIDGTASGACETGRDHPLQPPRVFARCCLGANDAASGLCVPKALLPTGAPELPKQNCTEPDSVCAPRDLVVDPTASFPTCGTRLSGDGLCIEDCFLSSLARSVSDAVSCGSGKHCVACSVLGAAIPGCR